MCPTAIEIPPSATDSDGFVGWLVWSRPPAQPLNNIVVTDNTGTTIANRPLPYGTSGSRSWDVALTQLGFERIGGWRPAVGGFSCSLKAR
jgi:hypothetical protein